MNAGADEVAASRAATAIATVPGTLQPPPELPWGGRPTPLKKGPAGASSEALAATGADIAAGGNGGVVVPQAEYSPKGYAPKKQRTLRSGRAAVPPRPPLAEPLPAQSPVAEPPGNPDVLYHYANAFQYVEVDGTYANLVISKPKLAQEDHHSLAEIAVQSADGNQIVEVGWTVDRGVNEGSEEPHLFVYHWVNRQESCYNACGFVQYSKSVAPGLKLPAGVSKRFGIEYHKGAWWIAYDSEWLGYFPDTLWRNKGVEFTKTGLIQWFGEVAASSSEPCTQMGTGSTPDKTSAARVGTIALILDNKDVPPAFSTMTKSEGAKTPVYSITPVSERTARYGGNGHKKCEKPEEG